MNRFLRLAFFAALPLAMCNIAPQAHAKPSSKARASAPRTVSDYFLLLPAKYTQGMAARFLDSASVRDDANDFIQSGLPDQPEITVALFRHAGRVLVAVRLRPTERTGSFDLLRLQNGRWKNVTRALVPRYSRANQYAIPRHGTTVGVFKPDAEVYDDPGTHLYDLIWRNGRFQIRR